ncbi:MAG TPA: cytochrome C [Rudaea sp.]|nr:cytochrome C [Rudaea sp.]
MRNPGTCLTAVLIGWSATREALALPSFAQQTGQPCATCHVGGFGPQLTPFGRAFKLGGYTLSMPDANAVPLAAMLVTSYTHTATDQPDAAGPHAGRNDNISLQEASLFLAGRMTDHIGVFAQTTYSDIDRKVTLDNVDVRGARTVTLGEQPAILGVSLNDNPAAQDAWNTLPAWRFPYMASELVPQIARAPLLDGGLEHQVVGASGYAFYRNAWYAEIGGYRSLSRGFLQSVNVEDSAGRIAGVAPYWRLAYEHVGQSHSWSVGAVGLDARLHPDRGTGPADTYRDTGLDASFEWFGAGRHVFTINGAYIHEHQDRDASVAAGTADRRTGSLDSLTFNTSYYYDAHYGVTLGRFDTRGTRDVGLFAPAPASGSRTGTPDSAGTILQVDWTPFGAKDSWNAPWANVRVGVQYTVYDKFNGASRNYDGFGRNAHDNDTLFLFLWAAL